MNLSLSRRPGQVAIEEALAHLMGLGGHDVGQHRDHAAAAHREDGHHLVVVAGIDIQLIPHQSRGLHDPGDVAVGLLDSHDVGVFGEGQVGVGLDAYAGVNALQLLPLI